MSGVAIQSAQLISHEGKPEAIELGRDITAQLERRGVGITAEQPDLIISLGGDGTMLRAAQAAHAADALLLGVNLGTVGYLTEVEKGDESGAIDRILDGHFAVEERLVLSCRATRAKGDESFVGLNEVLVERSSRHRLVGLSVRVGGERLAEYNADGVIIATPTGSTAYALSAGGPIVSPRAECLVIVPVSAHMLVARPFVVASDEPVDIEVEPGHEAFVSLDGAMGCHLYAGDSVLVERHSQPLRLARVGGPGFIERLRGKLDLPG